jgi:glutathione S-transferase
MILYGQYDSPFARRVAVSLHHFGIDFEHRSISVFGDFDTLRDKNPLGKVPVLELEDGTVLFESSYILDYLEECADPRLALMPTHGTARQEVLRMTAVALGIGEKAVELRGETVRRPDDYHYGPAIDRLRTQIAGARDWLEEQAGAPWLVGPSMTQADVTTAVAVTYLLRRFPELFEPDHQPRLAALNERCEALAPFRAAPFVDG